MHSVTESFIATDMFKGHHHTTKMFLSHDLVYLFKLYVRISNIDL